MQVLFILSFSSDFRPGPGCGMTVSWSWISVVLAVLGLGEVAGSAYVPLWVYSSAVAQTLHCVLLTEGIRLRSELRQTPTPERQMWLPVQLQCERHECSLTGKKLTREAATPDWGPEYWEWPCVPNLCTWCTLFPLQSNGRPLLDWTKGHFLVSRICPCIPTVFGKRSDASLCSFTHSTGI